MNYYHYTYIYIYNELIYYLSKIYFKIFFCQIFEYGIFILISALKLFNSKKNLPYIVDSR